jgi:hypothetical protein
MAQFIIKTLVQYKVPILVFLWLVTVYINLKKAPPPLDPCHFKLCYHLSKHNGKVVKVERNEMDRTGIWLTNSYLNYAFEQFEPQIYDLIQVGDSIVKRENSLEITVFDTLHRMKVVRLEYDACKSSF